MAKGKLPEKRRRFAEEYLVDGNATQAAIRAGYSERSAHVEGVRLLKDAKVALLIGEAQQKLSQKAGISAEMVLQQWWSIATADPNELIDIRRRCCRCCYGEDHRYQRTAGEMERDRSKHDAKRKEEGGLEDFDTMGGIGFDARKPPVEDCPECFGEGVPQVFPKDSRLLTGSGRLLYAGVKQTQNGLEIKMRDQDAALANVAKHLGMFVEKVEHQGKVIVEYDDGCDPDQE